MLLLLASIALFTSPVAQAQQGRDLPDPGDEKADMSKPVQVFIIMGQSNTLEMGKVNGGPGSLKHAVNEEGLYPFMVNEAGEWTTRQDVRNVSVMHKRGKMDVYRNDWLTVSGGKIGIEQGIGHQLGHALEAPVLVLKSSIGNRALGWDLLPPGSERFEFEEGGKTWVYPGYKDEHRHGRWEKGTVPPEPGHNWYAGIQYDWDVGNAKQVLENIGDYYPGATEYEVAGFLWWQGDRDSRETGHSQHYGKNLKTLIKALRKDFNAPDAKFVAATLGQTDRDNASGNEKAVIEGMFSIDGKDGARTVYTHPLSMGSSSGAHYDGNAKTYMNVGLAMGEAMEELLK